jgi:8-amino-3,8-dideoxy-alpha-D-manno-octulosonate transaminase
VHPELKAAVTHHANKDFSASDAVMSRCICTSISLSWTEEQVKEKGQRLAAAVQKVMKEQPQLAK